MNELTHHGIKGQKWGIRRYQNKDGSLTKAGLRRYGNVENFNRVQNAKSAASKRYKNYKASVRTQNEIDKINKKSDKKIEDYKNKHLKSAKEAKTISEMTDDEIRQKINRLRLENELKSLSPTKSSKGSAFVNTLKNKAVPTLVDSISDPVGKYIKKELSKQLGVNIEDKSKKLKQEAEDAINRQKKMAAEDWIDDRNKKKEAEESSNNKSDDKTNGSAASNSSEDTTYGNAADWRNVNSSSSYNTKTKRDTGFDRDNVVDVDYTVLKDDPVVDTGESYVQQLLLEEK